MYELEPDISTGVATLRRRAVRGGAVLALTRLALQALSWAVTIVVARYLRPFDYGVMSSGAVLLEFADRVAELGLTRALVRKPQLTDDDLAEAFSLSLLFSVVAYAVVYAAAGLFGAYFRNEEVQLYLRVAGLLLLLVPFRAVPLAKLEHQLLMEKQSALHGAVIVLQSVVSLAFAVTGFGYWALVAGVFAARLSEVGLLLGITHWQPRLKIPTATGRYLIHFGLQATTTNLLYSFYSTCDLLVLGRLGGPVVLGYFTIASNLVTLPVNKLTANANQILYPILCRLQHDPARMRVWYLRFVGIVGFVGLPVATGLVLVADDAIPLLLGEKWLPAASLLKIMALAGAVMIIVNTLTPIFNVINRPDINLKYTLACCASLVPAFYVLGRMYGAAGVAGAWTIVFPLVAGGMVFATRHLTGIGIPDLFWSLAPTLLALVPMILAVVLVRWILPGTRPTELVIAEVLAGASAFAVAAYFSGRRSVIRHLGILFAELRPGTRTEMSRA
ncbi:MAG TPA: lipopolysaccharide biosynthesis protein [Candidatus Acidoferrum sp.]|nr:lipopolysaccharide biosynthesis protein [Candidatus Acidoferrum sp.]